MIPKFNKGDQVQRTNDSSRIGVIVDVDVLHGGIQYYKVFFDGEERPVLSEFDIRPHIEGVSPVDVLRLGHLGFFEEFQLNILYQKLSKINILTNNLYSFNASRTNFYPYQFKPLLKFLDSFNNRVLIADEVGLGKTIEAGLIFQELKARQNLQRILVVCPSGLKDKWKMEMEHRFGEEFNIWRRPDLMRFLDKLEESYAVQSLKVIIPLETIRYRGVVERIEEIGPAFDLVIIDEAHHMRNQTTLNHRTGKVLSDFADAMVMLTATPVQMGNRDLFNLLHILDDENFSNHQVSEELFTQNEPVVLAQTCLSHIPADLERAGELLTDFFADLDKARKPYQHNLCLDVIDRMKQLKAVDQRLPEYRRQLVDIQRNVSELNFLGHILNRTRKRDVKEKIVLRQAKTVKVDLSDKEKVFYKAVEAFVRADAKRRGIDSRVIGWMLINPLRRTASCISAMVEHYKQHLDNSEVEDDDPLDDESDEKTESKSSGFELARNNLLEIINTWGGSTEDTKFQKFMEAIQKLKKEDGKLKIMVFAFYKATLRYLSKKLKAAGIKNLIISGDVPYKERAALINQFKDENSSIEVLLSSRVGSEGLDFQFCDTMVNYDLPWNPMEVEQRIGRLDRIGQRSQKIRIYNMSLADTIEDRVLMRLYERIGIFERSIGGLEPIMGAQIQELVTEVLTKELSAKEQEDLVERKALILEKKEREMRELEEKSAKFIGVDTYFEDEIARIQKTRRYITPQQLKKFILYFLERFFPKTRFEYSEKTCLGKIVADQALQGFISKCEKSHDLSRFYSTDGVEITFDSDTALQNPSIEFLNNTHPLTALILRYYQENPIHHNNAYFVKLDTNIAPKGKYFFYVFRLKIEAARHTNTIETVFIDETLNEICPGEDSEVLLGEMLESGRRSEDGSSFSIDPGYLDQSHRMALGTFLKNKEQRKSDAERSNNLLIEGRVASIRLNFEKKIKQKQKLLERGIQGNKKKSYLTMLEGEIRKYRNQMEAGITLEETKRSVSCSHVEIAAGILEIV
ncbi:MAG: helicase-related protein [Candidatus Omnitrophota bacterium]|nr:helicase-related protein [Candidatus Omnitrophota bacterium]